MPLIARVFLLISAATLGAGAEFVPPAEGPVPFRRDKLPLDVDTMTSLSRQVVILAGTRAGKTPAELRSVAQMAALALALDPANREARDLIARMKTGEAMAPPDEKQLERARARSWQAKAWLEMPEAGADGQALASCLGDVLAVADPYHPGAGDMRDEGEKGAWRDWVALEPAFQTKKPEAPVMKPEEIPETAPEIEHKALVVNEMRTSMPAWFTDKTSSEPQFSRLAVHLKASEAEPAAKGIQFTVAGDLKGRNFRSAFRGVEAALKERHGSLPSGLQIQIDCGEKTYSFERSGLALTGTTALLLDGAMTGKTPVASALAVVGADGTLELPARFWQSLRACSELPGGMRLILPDEAAEFLKALVVLDDAAFFMENEVLLAGTVEEMLDLAAAEPSPGLAEGLQKFEVIQEVGKDKALGPFVANSSTQQRLREVVTAMPNHASARMLALQGSGNRPRFLDLPVLAREIRSALEPAAYLVSMPLQKIEPATLEQLHETCRGKLDALAGYIDISDRELHKEAVGVADSLRTLGRLLPKKDPFDSVSLLSKQMSTYRAARSDYIAVMRKLNEAAGDGRDFPLPKMVDEP
ncbi:hypothetical protein [Luteolibacter marinus]|uniref:hypothetical protein n=1 Tax=Luteolibacter marinus TaxID=2776705 RepID=UPI001865E8DB|nr:hypothetical protein [Luteolibacter marinus]